MMFIVLLLSSFVFFNNAVPVDLQPTPKKNATGNVIQQILTHKNDNQPAKFLMNLFDGLDPGQIQTVVGLVRALLLTSEQELDQITLAATNAGDAFATSTADLNTAIVANDTGFRDSTQVFDDGVNVAQGLYDTTVTDLTSARDQNITRLQADVAAATSAHDAAERAKNVANKVEKDESARLQTEIDSLKSVISLLTNVKGLNPIPEDGLVSWFKPSSASVNWPSYVGDFRGVVHGSSPPTVVTEAGNGALVPITYLKGSNETKFHFGAVVLSTFTICSMSRYTGNENIGRILQGDATVNWLHGHWGKTVGAAYYVGWKARGVMDQNTRTHWVIVCGSSDPTQGVYVNGVEKAVDLEAGHGSPKDGNLWINSETTELSDWGVAEVITWNRVLSGAEILTVSKAMQTELSG